MTLRKYSIKIIYFLMYCLAIGLLVAMGSLYRNQYSLQQQIKDQASQESLLLSGGDGQQPQIVERIVTQSDIWRPVQEKTKDAVVQVYAQVVEFDFMQPYRPSMPRSASGSAFFINDQGYLITNAHVVAEAREVWIQIPSLGKRIIDVEVVGVSPERDLALLRLTSESLQVVRDELGSISYLSFGDSDLVHRTDEVLALGYPLGMQLKSTTGVISGRERQYIQISAPINPGNSGGPLLNVRGEVIGINSAGIVKAQNTGYSIPSNDLKAILASLYEKSFVRKPFLGVRINNASEALTSYLKNPHPGGCYIAEVIPGSSMDLIGVKSGDMLYEINGNKVDLYGEMSVPWAEDRLALTDYISRLSLDQEIQLVVYRNGQRKELVATFDNVVLPAIREVFPGLEEIDWEIFGGMVVMQLTMNHIKGLAQAVPGLTAFLELKKQSEPALIITHIFPTSQLHRTRSVAPGSTINSINGLPVSTLEDFRKVIRSSKGAEFLTLVTSDNYSRSSDNIMVALPFAKIINDEARLAKSFSYPITELTKEMIQFVKSDNK